MYYFSDIKFLIEMETISEKLILSNHELHIYGEADRMY